LKKFKKKNKKKNIQKNVGDPEKILAGIASFITPSSHANHRYLSAPQLARHPQHSCHQF